MTSTVTGVFNTRTLAEQAITQLEAAGITESQISLIMSDETRGSMFRLRESSKIDEGAAAGAGVGGIVGVIAGTVMAAGAIAIPGLNLVVTGALVSALAGLGAGAFTGGLVGALIGAGIPEHEAKLYEKQIKGGNVLVAVEARNSDQKKTVERIFDSINSQRSAA